MYAKSYIVKKNQIYTQENRIRDSISLFYGQNTETITFSLAHMLDFVVKTDSDEQVKFVVHSYWKQENVYVNSEYRDGESIRLLIYEDSHRILTDSIFYITYGIKFFAQKSKSYTIRFIDEGRISKLVALQMSKSVKVPQNIAQVSSLQKIKNDINALARQIKVFSAISEFSIVTQEKNSKTMQGYITAYQWYTIIQSLFLLLIVGVQLKVLVGMINKQSII